MDKKELPPSFETRFDAFDERQRKQIRWARHYTETDPDGVPHFMHGANGHNDLIIIAKLANMATDAYEEIDRLKALLTGQSDR